MSAVQFRANETVESMLVYRSKIVIYTVLLYGIAYLKIFLVFFHW